MKKVIKKNPILLLIPVLCMIVLVVLCCGFFRTAAESNDDNPEVLMNAEQTDPSADASSEPSAEPSSEPVTEPTERATEAPTEPVTEPIAPPEPEIEIPTEPEKTFDPQSISFEVRSTQLAGGVVVLPQATMRIEEIPMQSSEIRLPIYNNLGQNILTEFEVLTSLSLECHYQIISTAQEFRNYLNDYYNMRHIEINSSEQAENMKSKYNEQFFDNNVLLLISHAEKYDDPFVRTRVQSVVRNGDELSFNFETLVFDAMMTDCGWPEWRCDLIEIPYDDSLNTVSFYVKGEKYVW